MPPASPFPPAAPTVSGMDITVSTLLNSPPRVQRALEDLTAGRFVTDVILAPGPQAAGGAVIYDQVVENDAFLTGDAQAIAPGAEFPLLGDTEHNPLVAVARKWGGEMFLTYEEIRRDRRDVLGRKLTRLRNTIVKRVDAVAMAALRAAPILTASASDDWADPVTDIVTDLAAAQLAVDVLELPYVLDTVLIHPVQANALQTDAEIRDALPREVDQSLIRTGTIGRLLGLDFIKTTQVASGEVIFLARGIAGSVSDEVPLAAVPIDDPRRERTYVHGSRVVVPYITDPKAVVRMTGAAG